MKTNLIRFLQGLCLTALMANLMFAQTSTQSTASSSDQAATSSTGKTDDQLKQLQDAMTQQQQQIAKEQQEIEKLRQQVASQKNDATQKSDATPQVVDATLHTASANPAAVPASDMQYQDEGKDKESPLSFRIGGAEFTPGGFMDFTNVFRSTNATSATGTNPIGTSFGGIPFSNTAAGHLTEFRMSPQNSRLSLKATSDFKGFKTTGYVEADFLGNDAASIDVTSSSHVLRMRLYFVDLKKDKWEFLGGQTWGLETPGRVGISPMPSDIFYTQNMDVNYQAGLVWTRQAEFRAVYHADDHWALALAIQNPDQFTNGEVTFPTVFNATLGGEIDTNGQPGAPNLLPDFHAKLAYDSNPTGRNFHLEIGGMTTSVKDTVLPTVTDATFTSHTSIGGGGYFNTNLELFKNFHLITNAFWSDGGGRYLGTGLAPNFVVLPTNASGTTCLITGTGAAKAATGCDITNSMVHSGAGLGGFEWQATKKSMLTGYYGGIYAQRDYATDITSTAATQPFIGFGGPNSANSNNRSIQEGTIGWIQTFWKHPRYGALQLITQYSYLTRDSWFVAAGAPKNAHLSMAYVDLRYVLP